MRKILLLLSFVYSASVLNAQQKELDSLLNELKKHPQEDTIKIKLLIDISFDYEYIESNKGVNFAYQAIELSKKYNSQKNLSRAFMIMAQNYQTLGNDKKAIDLCNQGLAIAKKINDEKRIASLYETIGISYLTLSDYNTAIYYQQAGLIISKKLKNKELEGDFLNSLGVDYQYLGDYPKALAFFQQAIKTREAADLQDLNSDAFSNIGAIYNKLYDSVSALKYYQKALEINIKTGEKALAADCYGQIATIYDKNGDTAKSRFYLKKNLQLAREASYLGGIATSQINLGISYCNFKSYDSALYYLNSAIQTLKIDGNKTNLAIALTTLSTCYLKAPIKILQQYGILKDDKLKTALKLQLQSISIAVKINDLSALSEGYENLSKIYKATNNYKEALSAYEKSINYRDSAVNDKMKQQITRLEMQYDFNKKQDSVKVVNDKQQALAKAEIQKQHVVENSIAGGAGFLILAGIGGFVFYKRNHDIKLQKNEAELKSQITNTEMKALRAQMNPHFIFNSLNSIADYIDKNQTQIASDFTAKFAKLMRMVLENSEQKEIPLTDDLKALELYIQLERFRLNNKFDYEIKVDKTINQENTLVPPLILQPFVENSIWHGVAQKEGKGHIIIYIQKEGEMIHCIVEDDGGGIKEKQLINSKKSFGMKITKERIDVINKLKNAGAAMSVLNKEKGVRAEVKLPLELSF